MLLVTVVWTSLSVLSGLAAGFVLGRYGYHDTASVEEVKKLAKPSKYLAAELARSNRMEIK